MRTTTRNAATLAAALAALAGAPTGAAAADETAADEAAANEAAAPASEEAGRTRPAPPPAVAALLFDLEKMVEGQTSLGWDIDRYELDELMPHALLSVCAAAPEVHGGALAELDARIEELGGPVEDAYRKHGNDLGEISDLLRVSRARRLLDGAMLRAADECPFWIEPSPDFRGLQTDEGRFTLNVEGGGLLVLQRTAGKTYPGGGGSARVLLGRGLSASWTFLGGVEFGGNALFDQREEETRFPIGFTAAAPLVLRRNDLTWHYDMELAPLVYFTQSDTRVSPGGRVAKLIGVSALRIRHIMPWAGVGAAFEYVLETSARPALWSVKAGARIGFDWDF